MNTTTTEATVTAIDSTKRTYKTWEQIRIPDEQYYQIRGHAVEPAFGTYFINLGYPWAVAEDRSYNMGIGFEVRILFYTQTKEQAEIECSKLASTIGSFTRDHREGT